METLEHNVLRVQVFNSHHVQEHVIAEVETRIQWITLSLKNSLCIFGLQLLVSHEDRNTTVILASTACSSRHLDKLTTCYVSELFAIELFN
jgi:hypothetical protein